MTPGDLCVHRCNNDRQMRSGPLTRATVAMPLRSRTAGPALSPPRLIGNPT